MIHKPNRKYLGKYYENVRVFRKKYYLPLQGKNLQQKSHTKIIYFHFNHIKIGQ